MKMLGGPKAWWPCLCKRCRRERPPQKQRTKRWAKRVDRQAWQSAVADQLISANLERTSR